jgi:hypothetical protein
LPLVVPALALFVLRGASALSVGALISGVGIPGCTVLTNDAPPDDAGKFEGGGDASSTACTSCVAQECTGTWAVCLTDSRCIALRGCNNPFGESKAARDQCFCASADASSSSPATADGGADPLGAYAAFASCNDARTCGKCATDCTSTCANGAPMTTAGACGQDDAGTPGADDAGNDAGTDDAGDAGAPDATVGPETPSVDRCATCVSDKCGNGKKACALGSECSVFLACAYGCADAACVDACGKSHSTGQASAMELSNCTLTSCRSACGL